MAVLGKVIAVVVLGLASYGCMSASVGFWLTDEELDAYRKRGGIEVSSPDGLYNGILERVPTNAWKVVSFPILQYRMEVPEQIAVGDAPDWNGFSLYAIHSRYPDARYGAQVIVTRKTRGRYEEDVGRLKESLARPIYVKWTEEQKREIEWRNIRFHQTLEVEAGGTLYRRDIRCANGDVLEIEGMVEELTDRKTGQSLFPEMDAVIRRIINSIEPLSVTTNK
jgi:hypothetical protein